MEVNEQFVKLSEIEGVEKSLSALCGMLLPVKESWAVAKLHRAVKAELAGYREAMDGALKRFGTTENGFQFNISKENAEAFQKEVNELNETSASIVFPVISLNAFKGKGVAPETLLPLMDRMFFEPEAE
jgi:hypothetical protein